MALDINSFKKQNTGKNPMISDEVIGYLNMRIEQEELSSRMYLSMSMWLNN